MKTDKSSNPVFRVDFILNKISESSHLNDCPSSPFLLAFALERLWRAKSASSNCHAH